MSGYQFSDNPARRHRVIASGNGLQVDGTELTVHEAYPGCFVATIAGSSERLYAVTHGDTTYVQLKGRAWRLVRLDPTRSEAATVAAHAGVLHAPMPGVVVSRLVEEGQRVKCGEALLVIESMKLQVTISAPIAGNVEHLPFAVDATFQRGAVLASLRADEDSA